MHMFKTKVTRPFRIIDIHYYKYFLLCGKLNPTPKCYPPSYFDIFYCEEKTNQAEGGSMKKQDGVQLGISGNLKLKLNNFERARNSQ